MTIDDQLRVLARHADQHQQVITAQEIIHRGSSQDIGPFTTRSEFNDRQQGLDHIPVEFNEEDATMIDLETPSPTGEHRRGPNRAMLAGVLAAAAVIAIVVAATRVDDATPADQPSPTVTVTVTVPPTLPPATWSAELTARPLEAPIDCNQYCPHLGVSPDGTLVALDESGQTLTWYEDEPRAVPLTPPLGSNNALWAIGPYDVAYIISKYGLVAVAPSGVEITRMPWPSNKSVYPTSAGLVSGDNAVNSTATDLVPGEIFGSSPDLLMPWVDLDGNPITDTTPYPTLTRTDAGIEVRHGEREWLLAEYAETSPGRPYFTDLLARSDGGVVVVLPGSEVVGEANLFELLPDGTIEGYFVPRPLAVLPDGSLIVEHNLELIRLTPPA